MSGPFSGTHNCDRGWYAGRYRSPSSMCVSVVSDDDVRCYQQCQYGNGIETFVVPDQQTCMSYDSAYASSGGPSLSDRQKVLTSLAAIVLKNATGKAEIALMRMREERSKLLEQLRLNGTNISSSSSKEMRRLLEPLDMTRQLIGDGIQTMENDGLNWLEDSACVAFTGPAAPFCSWVVSSPIGQYVNNEIENIPVVEHVANWLGNTAMEWVPPGVSNAIDDVSDAWNSGGGSSSSFESAVGSAASSICSGLFGWI
jgi:hypothetical protein